MEQAIEIFTQAFKGSGDWSKNVIKLKQNGK